MTGNYRAVRLQGRAEQTCAETSMGHKVTPTPFDVTLAGGPKACRAQPAKNHYSSTVTTKPRKIACVSSSSLEDKSGCSGNTSARDNSNGLLLRLYSQSRLGATLLRPIPFMYACDMFLCFGCVFMCHVFMFPLTTRRRRQKPNHEHPIMLNGCQRTFPLDVPTAPWLMSMSPPHC